MKTILKCSKLNKYIKDKHIIKDLNLELEEGDILGFIGPNGAGKTTTMKLILGLQKTDSGTIEINGYNIKDNFKQAISKVGAIIEYPDLYSYLTGYQNLKLIMNMYKDIEEEYVQKLIKMVGLENRINDKISTYSLGMLERLAIAASLINKPNILILDEPTNGLDPEGIRDLRILLKKLSKEDNIAILISSHNLSELDNLCNKICIIQNGTIIENKTNKELKKEINNNIIFKVSSTKKIPKILKEAKILSSEKFIISLQDNKIPELINKLIKENIKIYRIEEQNVSLEDVFLNKTGGNKID